MAQRHSVLAALWFGGAGVFFGQNDLRAEDTQEQLRQLQQQNQALQEQLRQQKALIDSLTEKVGAIQQANTHYGRQLDEMQTQPKDSAMSTASQRGYGLGSVHIGGEGGVGFFESGSEGMFPHGEFRIDEMRLFFEAPVWEPVYFYAELNLATREDDAVAAQLGEAYIDFESVSRLWNQENTLSLRVGRMYTPFGEEYANRYAIDNPLISHSLPDLWSVDEGIEFYGKAGKFGYAMAVQNGGIPDTHDFDSDKSIAGRIGFDPTSWLHLSASGMRTGNLDVSGDFLSAMWFGNGFFKSIGGPGTSVFHVDLAEADVEVCWPKGHLKTFGGWADYGDNDPAGSNHRDIYYYSVEGVQEVLPRFYAAARFSQILVNGGYPIVANGTFAQYFGTTFTDEIWRLSLGLGYRFGPGLVVKGEYCFERGHETDGDVRNHEDLFAMEVAYKF